METNEFKGLFNEIAKNAGFEKAYEGWFKEFQEVILVLELQKSKYGNQYYLNVKLFIQGLFGNVYTKNKDLVKKEGGDIFLRHPNHYSNLLDLDAPLDAKEREKCLKEMFRDFIIPFADKTNSKERIKDLHKQGELFILPAVKRELGI